MEEYERLASDVSAIKNTVDNRVVKELGSMNQVLAGPPIFLELELNLVPVFLQFLCRGTELYEQSSSSSTHFLELELNLVPFKKELSQPCATMPF